MSLLERLNDDLKAALRSGDSRRRSVIRLLLAAVKEAELVKNGPLTPDQVAATLKAANLNLGRDQTRAALEASWAYQRGEPVPAGLATAAVVALASAGAAKKARGGPLTDDEVLDIIQRQAKQRRDSIAAYTAGGRSDLADNEAAELAVLTGYLPQPLGTDELKHLIAEVIGSTGASGPRDIGRVMPVVMARVGPLADGRTVSSLVKELLR
jgi:hypothetical protein